MRSRKSVAARKLMLELFQSETHIDTRYDLLNAATKLQDNNEVRQLLRTTIRDPKSPWKILRGCAWGYLRQGQTGKDMFVEDFSVATVRVQDAVCEIFGRMKTHPGATAALHEALAEGARQAARPRQGDRGRGGVRLRTRPRAARTSRRQGLGECGSLKATKHPFLPVAAEATRQLADVDLKRALSSARRIALKAEMFEWGPQAPARSGCAWS